MSKYLEWNSRIGEHFFGQDSAGRRVVMCVTRDTLAEVSGLPPEDALKDFVAAVLEGPDWNRIQGCTYLETKVYCCLHVDPQWGQHWSDAKVNPPRVRELQDLSQHVYWADYGPTKLDDDHPHRYPPYLAYLAAFVLAWTERDSDYNGNDFYDPLLDLLGGRERWPERPAFGRPCCINGCEYTINDVWKDLMSFCESFSRAELILPDTVLRAGRYIDTPKFFGLMKASDLRDLDGLFIAMEQASQLSPDLIPPARELVIRVVRFGQVARFLSSTCLNSLRSAVSAQDSSLSEAYGRLLQSKYRDFDGLPEEGDLSLSGTPQRTARLLRVLERNGNVKVVCRLRSLKASKKLPLEEHSEYCFKAGDLELSTHWIPGSEWFTPAELPLESPLSRLELECDALRIKASMPAKDFIVLHSPPAIYVLAGCKVEVDEVEKGRQYVLLARGNEKPAVAGTHMISMNIPCPAGFKCWSFSVPADATTESWSMCLPPLLEERTPRPKLSFSGFRLEPRTTRFPVGLPVRIRCNVDNVELVVKGDIDQFDLHEEDDAVWNLESHKSGIVSLSLRDLQNHHIPPGWRDQELHFEDLLEGGARSREFPRKLVYDPGTPPCPEALLELVGGAMDPRCAGDDASKVYFVSALPRVKVTARNLHSESGLRVLLGGKACPPAQSGLFALPMVEANQRLLIEVKDGDTVLGGRLLRFSHTPELQVKCASDSKDRPLPIGNSLVATVRGDEGLVFDWEIRNGETRLSGGQAKIDASGTWQGMLLARGDTALEAGKAYEVRFGFGVMFPVRNGSNLLVAGSSGRIGQACVGCIQFARKRIQEHPVIREWGGRKTMTPLDLLTALGSLPLSGEGSFKDAVEAVAVNANAFSHRRFLEGLGHARVDRAAGRIDALAPRLVALPREEEGICRAVLAGARSVDLLQELAYLSSSMGVEMDRVSLGEGFPERVTFIGRPDALRDLARRCCSLPVEISPDPSTPDAWRLLSSVQGLRTVILGLTREETGYSREEPLPSADVFNPITGYFNSWSTLRDGYSSRYALWRKEVYDYRLFWCQPDGEELAGGRWIQRLARLDFESFWARWAVAYSADPIGALPPVSIDGDYKVPTKIPLPVELHRVCCLCSGFQPVERDGFFHYENVPPVIQQGVNDRLTVDNPIPPMN